jgi:hypothetical protein
MPRLKSKRPSKISRLKLAAAASIIAAVIFMTWATSGWSLALLSGLIFLFAGTVIFGAPYVPTRKSDRQAALQLFDLKPGQTLIEMGAGEGSLCLEASRLGVKCIGYEINPILALIARIRTWRYRSICKIICGDMWEADLSKADGIYVFLAGRIADKFTKKFQAEARPGCRLVSQGFELSAKEVRSSGSLRLYER